MKERIHIETRICDQGLRFRYSLAIAVVLAEHFLVGQRIREEYEISLCNVGGVDAKRAVAFQEQTGKVRKEVISNGDSYHTHIVSDLLVNI